jgi:hypothetical protein
MTLSGYWGLELEFTGRGKGSEQFIPTPFGYPYNIIFSGRIYIQQSLYQTISHAQMMINR